MSESTIAAPAFTAPPSVVEPLSAAVAAVPEAASAERLHALDAVRGFALLLGIFFHATASFLVAPQQMWMIVDKSPSTTLTLAFYLLHMFRMTTFFLIAGFFAHLLYHRRGERGFIRDRLRRIGLPLVAGWPVLIVALSAGVIWAAWVMNGGKFPPAPPPDPNAPLLAFPLTHLWFLYVLLWFYALTVLVRRLLQSLDPHGRGRARLDALVGALVRNPFGVVALGAPACIALFALPVWRPWLGIPTPDDSLLPNIAAFTAFSWAFAFGWLLHRQTALLETIEKRWPWHLFLAVAATVGCLAYVGVAGSVDVKCWLCDGIAHDPRNLATSVAPHDLATFGYAFGYALAGWCWTLALIGLALRFLSGYSAARRYVADASYWLYLIHMPIVLALQVAVSQLSWHWTLKYALILGIAFPIMFATYRYWVRGTFIGAVLNGRRYPRTLPAAARAAESVRLEGPA
jgi:glucans biosynthesis protein C